MNIKKQFNIKQDAIGVIPTPPNLLRVTVTLRPYYGNNIDFHLDENGAYVVTELKLENLLQKYLFEADTPEQVLSWHDNDFIETIETTSASIVLAPNGVALSVQRGELSSLYREVQEDYPKYKPEMTHCAPQEMIRRHLQHILDEAVSFYEGGKEFYSE
jgi:hypothetical protein